MNSDTDNGAGGELQRRIRATIPLSEAMRFQIESLQDDSIAVSAPLEPNINIHGTGFAGSIYSLAVLTGWALCTHMLERAGVDAELVVARAEIRYRAPVDGTLECKTLAADDARTEFLDGVVSSGKGLINLEVRVGEKPSAVLNATYCAIGRVSNDSE